MSTGPAVLFWDIDGTLLTTARAGIFALEEAFEEVTGRPVDLQELTASGLTEHEVAQAVFAAAGIEGDDELTDRLLRAYERRLPSCLPRRQGRVLPGVRQVLEELAPRDDVISILLTGNTQAGARAKLAHYGLLDFFSGGAYCIGPGPRTDIAQRALSLADGSEELYVIGDTPYDIACGRAIGVRTIAVATGSYSRDELAQHEPWALVDQIDPAEFLRLVGLRGD